VIEQMASGIDLRIDGGPTRYAKASTVIRVHARSPSASSGGTIRAAGGAGDFTVVREGVYDERALRRLAAMNILFVCAGNTCRSPMAAGLCRKLLASRLGCSPRDLERHGYQVNSAGLSAYDGGPAAADAVAVMRDRGVDISGHTTQAMTADLARQADAIFAMTSAQVDWIADLAPEAAERVQLLASDGDIDDPVGSGPEVYSACADRIEQSIARRLTGIEP
jgi:protein-tyrosine phosphatase